MSMLKARSSPTDTGVVLLVVEKDVLAFRSFLPFVPAGGPPTLF